jgi:methyl-accepting chemotaxis protein
MNNLKIAVRLALGFSVVLVMMLIATATGVLGFKGVGEAFQESNDRQQRVTLTQEWVVSTRLNIDRVMVLARAGNDPAIESHLAPLMKETTGRINELQKELEAKITSERGKALLVEVGQLRAKYIETRKAFFDQLKSGDTASAEAALTGQLLPAANAYLGKMGDLLDYQVGVNKTFAASVDDRISSASAWLIGLAAAALVAGVVFAFRITRSVTLPVARAVHLAESIAAGNLSTTIIVDRKDELGLLLDALGQMQVALGGVVSEIRGATESIETASAEIASGNQDLSGRTEQAAANLEETASSMEEMTATVQQSADSAHQAMQLASQATEAAQRGGDAVGRVVATMESIDQSSRKISDIIGVIDGIAFQTNILALNAAVEAARAGEHGHGFAVVASEVRTLAQRSADAAKEIKSLISASVERVSEGSAQVKAAGTTTQDIVQSVQRVMEVISEIEMAAREQKDGIGQINAAVGQLDQMTQQNAALVEESAAAAESLKGQAKQLANAVAVFKLS